MSEIGAKSCFVIMPFGKKSADNPLWTEHDSIGKEIDFDAVYDEIIEPAITELGIDCTRCDEIAKSGSIHKTMITGIATADLAIVDLSTLNPNVFYELGVRHALRPAVTILLRHAGIEKAIPFNIGGMKVVDYDPDAKEESRKRIQEYATSGLSEPEWQDSLVHEMLPDLHVTVQPPQPISETTVHEWTVVGNPDKRVGLITGDIARVKGIDIWGNSENTDMQMARFHDRSVSGTIRYLGATKSVTGQVKQDLLADALASAMREDGLSSVAPATVIPISAKGQLHATNGVRWVFNVASVVGQRGRGYSPIPDITACVTNALERASSPEFLMSDTAEYDDDASSTSILLPLFGAGRADAGLHTTATALLGSAVTYLQQNPGCTIDSVYFLAWSDVVRDTCVGILEASNDVEATTPTK